MPGEQGLARPASETAFNLPRKQARNLDPSFVSGCAWLRNATRSNYTASEWSSICFQWLLTVLFFTISVPHFLHREFVR